MLTFSKPVEGEGMFGMIGGESMGLFEQNGGTGFWIWRACRCIMGRWWRWTGFRWG